MTTLAVNLAWTADATNTDGSPITGAVTYNVYQGTAANALTKVQSGLTATSVTVNTGLTPGAEAFFAVSATAEGQESGQSTVVSIAIPALVPSAPTGLTATVS